MEDVGAEGEGACEDVFGDKGRTRARWCVWGCVCKRETATGIGELAVKALRPLCREGVNCAVRAGRWPGGPECLANDRTLLGRAVRFCHLHARLGLACVRDEASPPKLFDELAAQQHHNRRNGQIKREARCKARFSQEKRTICQFIHQSRQGGV